MKRIAIRERTPIPPPPFGEPARSSNLNKPLWLLQRDLLAHQCRGAEEADPVSRFQRSGEELLVYRTTSFHDLLDRYPSSNRRSGHARQIGTARAMINRSRHALRLQIQPRHNVQRPTWSIPTWRGRRAAAAAGDRHLPRDGLLSYPCYMAPNQGDLVPSVPPRALPDREPSACILAELLFGCLGPRPRTKVDSSWREKLAVSRSVIGSPALAWRKGHFRAHGWSRSVETLDRPAI